MPIGSAGSSIRAHSDEVADYLVRPVLLEHYFDPLLIRRSDEDEHSESITDRIVRHLVEDDLVICDITGYNPNVFYELAARHAYRRPVIIIGPDGAKLPFDVGDLNTLFYAQDSWASLDKSRRSLSERVKYALGPDYRAGNPLERFEVISRVREADRSRGEGQALVAETMYELKSQIRRLADEVEELRLSAGGRRIATSEVSPPGGDERPF